MKGIYLSLSTLLLVLIVPASYAQQKIPHFIYYNYDYDSDHTDTAQTFVELSGNHFVVTNLGEVKHPIPGYAVEKTYADYSSDSIYYQYIIDGESFYTSSPAQRSDIKWDSQVVDSKTVRYVTSINSNRIEMLFSTKEGVDVNPLPYYGKFKGLLKEMKRNGLVQIELAKVVKARKSAKDESLIPSDLGQWKTSREINAIKRQRMVLTTHVFENEQICWGREKPEVADIPFDTTLHYAGGTLILKRVRLPKLPKHYQTFVELRQRSNGDAYDRTGSVFVIPDASEAGTPTFLDGILGHPDSLPTLVGRDGERYQGIIGGKSPMKVYSHSPRCYRPSLELMRFFTPFGVGHFNDRVKLEGLEWREETYYKQEITDIYSAIEGDIIIGVFIGNYDAGGHIVSLDFKSYPNDREWLLDDNSTDVVPLLNTCNVLEMAGQNYGKVFGTDSLTVDFYLDEGDHALLRYISTGHGGWGGGDEFNPKENEIFIDGVKRFSHTPWRCDCGRYREWNPVSGNFWNGLSSSDLSRSGWCPGTATQPVYFDLSDLTQGRHTLTVAIPQGKPMEGGFSHWNVSAALILNE